MQNQVALIVSGKFDILEGRALLSGLGIGVLSYTTDGATAYLAVNGGYVEVDDAGVIVVTETAETPGEIDVERARTALARIQKEAASLEADAAAELARVNASIQRAENRIDVAKLAKPSMPNQ